MKLKLQKEESEQGICLFLCFCVLCKKERSNSRGQGSFVVQVIAMMTSGCTHLALSATVKKWVIMNRLKEQRFGIFFVCLCVCWLFWTLHSRIMSPLLICEIAVQIKDTIISLRLKIAMTDSYYCFCFSVYFIDYLEARFCQHYVTNFNIILPTPFQILQFYLEYMYF